MIKEFLEYMYNIKFDSESIGIQKDLLLAALIGTIANLPKDVKSNFKQVAYIIVGTLLATILTPMIIAIIGAVFHTDLPPESGYGIAALVGIVGINTIKKMLISRLTASDKKDENNS